MDNFCPEGIGVQDSHGSVGQPGYSCIISTVEGAENSIRHKASEIVRKSIIAGGPEEDVGKSSMGHGSNQAARIFLVGECSESQGHVTKGEETSGLGPDRSSGLPFSPIRQDEPVPRRFNEVSQIVGDRGEFLTTINIFSVLDGIEGDQSALGVFIPKSAEENLVDSRCSIDRHEQSCLVGYAEQDRLAKKAEFNLNPNFDACSREEMDEGRVLSELCKLPTGVSNTRG